jgi:hypothetical protein
MMPLGGHLMVEAKVVKVDRQKNNRMMDESESDICISSMTLTHNSKAARLSINGGTTTSTIPIQKPKI